MIFSLRILPPTGLTEHLVGSQSLVSSVVIEGVVEEVDNDV